MASSFRLFFYKTCLGYRTAIAMPNKDRQHDRFMFLYLLVII